MYTRMSIAEFRAKGSLDVHVEGIAIASYNNNYIY